jgi:hypothetical protein
MDEKALFNVESIAGDCPVPTTVRMNAAWGPEFSHATGFALRFAQGVSAHLFLHQGLLSNDPREVIELFKRDAILGYILSCEEQEWTIKGEATFEGHFGFVVHTKSGKPYLAGHGTFDHLGRWSATFSTLYPGISNKKKCSLQGGVKGGTGQRTEVQVGGSCGVTF